jgi:hypothetical protein
LQPNWEMRLLMKILFGEQRSGGSRARLAGDVRSRKVSRLKGVSCFCRSARARDYCTCASSGCDGRNGEKQPADYLGTAPIHPSIHFTETEREMQRVRFRRRPNSYSHIHRCAMGNNHETNTSIARPRPLLLYFRTPYRPSVMTRFPRRRSLFSR